jgi:hypothetical protein
MAQAAALNARKPVVAVAGCVALACRHCRLTKHLQGQLIAASKADASLWQGPFCAGFKGNTFIQALPP